MKVLFRNKTKYNKENCDNFINFHANKYGIKELIKYIVAVIFIIYIIIFNIVYKNWYLIIGAILIGIIIHFINIKKEEKVKKERKKIKEYTFYFYERYIKIKYRKQFERMLYLNITKVFETDDNFFLYTDSKHSIILDKDGFEIGTAKEFSEFIKRKCPLRYSNQKEK